MAKLTASDRDFLRRLIDTFGPRLEGWLVRVADGDPPVIDHATGEVVCKGAPPDPGRALQIYAQMLEFVRPRLSRAEVQVEDVRPSRADLLAQARALGVDERLLFLPHGTVAAPEPAGSPTGDDHGSTH